MSSKDLVLPTSRRWRRARVPAFWPAGLGEPEAVTCLDLDRVQDAEFRRLLVEGCAEGRRPCTVEQSQRRYSAAHSREAAASNMALWGVTALVASLPADLIAFVSTGTPWAVTAWMASLWVQPIAAAWTVAWLARLRWLRVQQPMPVDVQHLVVAETETRLLPPELKTLISDLHTYLVLARNTPQFDQVVDLVYRGQANVAAAMRCRELGTEKDLAMAGQLAGEAAGLAEQAKALVAWPGKKPELPPSTAEDEVLRARLAAICAPSEPADDDLPDDAPAWLLQARSAGSTGGAALPPV